MRTKLRSKKGVTLTEVIITLVVSSIFFVMVGSIIVAYRNVTNTAINTTSATSAATLVSNSFEKMTNFCNSSEDNHLYYKRNTEDDTFVFYVYQGNGTPTKEDLDTNPKYRIMEYTKSNLYYTNSVTGLEIKVDTNNLEGIKYRVTNKQILNISILDSEGYLIMERTYRLYGEVQMITG